MTADFDRGRVDLAHEADFSLGPIHVRPSTRQVELGGASETLEPRIMQVLVVLARRRGEVVSRDDLIEACWEGRVVGDDALNRCVARIRKIGETSGAFRLETIPRVGYRLWVEEQAGASPAQASAEQKPVQRSRGEAYSRWLIPAVALAALVLSAGLAWWLSLNSKTVDVVAGTEAITIRQFEAPDGSVEAQNLARAVPTVIAEELTGVGMNVRTQARESGSESGSSYVVDGSVVKSGESARVFVRVDHVATGVTILSTTVEGPAGNVAMFADRLSTDVARYLSWPPALRILNSRDTAEISIRPIYISSLRSLGEGDYLAAAALARRAWQMAPNSPDANQAVAIQGMQAVGLLDPADRPAAWREAIAAADKAMQLSPHEGGSFLAKMWTLPPVFWSERIDLLRSGVAQDPENGSTYGFLNGLYLSTGKFERAKIAIAQGRARDPLDTGKMFRQAQTHLVVGDFGAARVSFAELDRRAGLDFPRAYDLLIPTSVWWMRADESRALLSRPVPPMARVSNNHHALLEAIVEAQSGSSDAIERVWTACELNRPDKLMRLTCMSAGARLGRLDVAFAAASELFPDMRGSLSNAMDEAWLVAPVSSLDAVYLFMPWASSLRSDKRIIPVFERLGLLDYWRKGGEWPDFCETEPQSVCAQMMAGAPS